MPQEFDIDVSCFPSFSDFLQEKGNDEAITLRAEKMAIALQLVEQMEKQNISKSQMAERLGTSRAQVDRILNPKSQNVTIETLARAAAALGRRFHMELI